MAFEHIFRIVIPKIHNSAFNKINATEPSILFTVNAGIRINFYLTNFFAPAIPET